MSVKQVYHGQVVGYRRDPSYPGMRVPLCANIGELGTQIHYHNNGRGKDGEKSPGYREVKVTIYKSAFLDKPGKNSWRARAAREEQFWNRRPFAD